MNNNICILKTFLVFELFSEKKLKMIHLAKSFFKMKQKTSKNITHNRLNMMRDISIFFLLNN